MAKKLAIATTTATKSIEDQINEVNQFFGTSPEIEKDRTLMEIFTEWKKENPNFTPILTKRQIALLTNFLTKYKEIFGKTSDKISEAITPEIAFGFLGQIYEIYEISEKSRNLSMVEFMLVIQYVTPQIEKSFRSLVS